jgi:hypothetical protein
METPPWDIDAAGAVPGFAVVPALRWIVLQRQLSDSQTVVPENVVPENSDTSVLKFWFEHG